MGEMKNILLAQLRDPKRSVEEQEKTLELVLLFFSRVHLIDQWYTFFRILLELSTSDDPTWVYFDTQHKHVMDQLKEVFKTTSARVEGMILP